MMICMFIMVDMCYKRSMSIQYTNCSMVDIEMYSIQCHYVRYNISTVLDI